MHKPQRSLIFDSVSGTFSKEINDPRALAAEARKSRQARELGCLTGLFTVPEVLSDSGGLLVTKEVPGLQALRSVLHAGGPEGIAWVGQSGAALATVHARLPVDLPECRPCQDWFCRTDAVPVHGDYGLHNVQVRPEGGICILDWAPPFWRPTLGSVASSYWDVSLFLVDLHYQRPRDPLHIARPSRLGRVFIAAYTDIRPLRRADLRRSILEMTGRYYRGAVRGNARLARVPSSAGLFLSTMRSRTNTYPRRMFSDVNR